MRPTNRRPGATIRLLRPCPLHEPRKNIEHRTSNTQRPMRRTIRCSAFDVGCSMFLMDAEARFMVLMRAQKRKEASHEVSIGEGTAMSARIKSEELADKAVRPPVRHRFMRL